MIVLCTRGSLSAVYVRCMIGWRDNYLCIRRSEESGFEKWARVCCTSSARPSMSDEQMCAVAATR